MYEHTTLQLVAFGFGMALAMCWWLYLGLGLLGLALVVRSVRSYDWVVPPPDRRWMGLALVLTALAPLLVMAGFSYGIREGIDIGPEGGALAEGIGWASALVYLASPLLICVYGLTILGRGLFRRMRRSACNEFAGPAAGP